MIVNQITLVGLLFEYLLQKYLRVFVWFNQQKSGSTMHKNKESVKDNYKWKQDVPIYIWGGLARLFAKR